MTDTRYDVVGIGNAIVDIIGRCDDGFLARHGAPKGHMRLVDAETVAQLYADMGPGIEISGGSVANTMVGLASFGGRAAFIGKVADDEFGPVITETPEIEDQPSWSPDGTRVAYRRAPRGGTTSEIWVMPALGGFARRLVSGGVDPAWSPDCRMLAFYSTRGGVFISSPEGLNQNMVIPGVAETLRWSR